MGEIGIMDVLVEKKHLNLMQFFEGYVNCYRTMNLSADHNTSMFTKREIEFFMKLGEMLGFHVFIEDFKPNEELGRSRPMDLAWWKWDARIDLKHYAYLALHLERESLAQKDIETIDKLFSTTDSGYVPHNVIGIQYVTSADRMDLLNERILEKNKVQQSNVLIVYRYIDDVLNVQRVHAYSITNEGIKEERNAILQQDRLGYYYMCFEEEYARIK